MQYTVVMTTKVSELKEKVNEHLSHGWKLQGGVSASVAEEEEKFNVLFVQALVKDVESA